jgi:hypothetical protein
MNLAAVARIAVYVVVVLSLGALAVAGNERTRLPDTAWREPLQRIDTAVAGGDARGAMQAWEMAYRAAMRARTPEGMLEVGRAALRIGEAAGDRQTAVAQARRIFLEALFQARERRDPSGVARAGEAFASLGDREVAGRAFEVAMALAVQNRDAETHERVAVLRTRLNSPRRAP